MSDPSFPGLVFGIDLTGREHSELAAALPSGLKLESTASGPEGDGGGAPHEAWLALFPWRTWEKMTDEQVAGTTRWARHRVLLLDRDEQLDGASLERLMNQGLLAVISSPVTNDRMERLLDQAQEVDDLHRDIYRMTREIELERELFARKNRQLVFLNKILTHATQSLDVEVILQRFARDLSDLVKVADVAAVFWDEDSGPSTDADLFFPANARDKQPVDWIEYLLETANRLSGKNVDSYRTGALPATQAGCDAPPETVPRLVFPLGEELKPFGALIIVSREASQLGRDRMTVIQAAVRHLSLALRNGYRYRAIKRLADHDGLTLLHNRQHFDKRIIEELKRHQRHHQTLSLLMLDLDRFKSINDTHGHLAGDMVLHELGRLLLETLRETDFPARYGGEEFVVILPHTNQQQSLILAERIRKRLSKRSFTYEGRTFRVTGSIGIATIRPASLHGPEELIRQADRALYLAKARGRNMVCVSSAENATTAASAPCLTSS